jgi:lipoprotein signal peptidase
LKRKRVVGVFVAICLLACAFVVGRIALRVRQPGTIYVALTAVPMLVSGAIGIICDRLETALVVGGTVAVLAEAYYLFWILAAS